MALKDVPQSVWDEINCLLAKFDRPTSSSKEIDYIKRCANKNTIWIDTAGTGLALADRLENKGVPINRFTLLDQRALQKYLNCG